VIERLRESKNWQFLLIAALILVVPLIVDINERVSDIRRKRQELTRLDTELAEVKAEHEALLEELEFVNGDAYLEQWARTDARMTKPGEVVIIPLPTDSAGQTDAELENASSRTDGELSIPEQWHRLFFGNVSAP
jgi:cell division protein FtsB